MAGKLLSPHRKSMQSSQAFCWGHLLSIVAYEPHLVRVRLVGKCWEGIEGGQQGNWQRSFLLLGGTTIDGRKRQWNTEDAVLQN